MELKPVVGGKEGPKGQISPLFAINLCSSIALFSVGLVGAFSST